MAQKWEGLELPNGLAAEQAEQASRLIYEFIDDWPDHQDCEGSRLSLPELVLKLNELLCGAPEK